MSRGKPIKREQKEPDMIFKSRVVAKAINMIMLDGKKSTAKKILHGMMNAINEDKKEARRIFEEAVKNVMPSVEVRSRRIGGANYSIPVPLKHDRSETLALRWIINVSRSKKGKPMHLKLLDEIKLAYNKEGGAMKKKSDAMKMAEANRAFSHFKF